MLRARALQERGNSYVCAFCRHKLSPREGQLKDRYFSTVAASIASVRTSTRSQCSGTQLLGTRTLSTSSLLHQQEGNGNPSKPGGFPGGGGFGVGVGNFGAFANKSPATPSDKPNLDTLLPHEREARQRMGISSPKPPPKISSKNRDSNTDFGNNKKSKNKKVRGGKNYTDTRGEAEAGSNAPGSQAPPLSSSLLADAFKTDRNPRPVATPAAWSGFKPGPIQTPQADSKPDPWGAFSARKVDTEVPDQKKPTRNKPSPQQQSKSSNNGDGSAVWGQLKRSAHKTSAKPTQGGDFWDNLETKVSELREQKRENVEAAVRRGSDEPVSFEAGRRAQGASPQSYQGQSIDQSRRRSRFEEEEEGNTAFSRNGKRGKKQKNSRRNTAQDDWDDEAVQRWESRQRRKADKEAKRLAGEQAEEKPVQIFLPEYISVSNLAQAMKLPISGFLRDLEAMGFEDLTEDTIMTGDTAALVSMEYGLDPVIESGADLDLRPLPPPEDPSTLPSRPPVVTIMGHVDHGKTTLLDWLRKSSIAAQEHGGITQHIGAFVVQMSTGKQITFLDTPGHAAFLSMRQRGANVTDIVVLVVAADDSVMPQTIEALKHATAAKVPIIVAINKIDKEDARVDQVKADLSRHGVEIEDYGGDVQVVPVSGKTGKGMEDLEENIITLSEILDVRAETDIAAEGWILESSVKQIGKVASVLVKRGTLRLGDYIVAGKTWARIRGLRNEAGVEIPEAPPGTPVEILGWRDLPEAGEQVLQAPDEDKAKTAVEYRQEMADREQSSAQLAEQEQRMREKAAAEEAAAQAAKAGDTVAKPDEGPSIKYQNFIIKADVAGSVEAVTSHIQEIGNNEVQTKVLRSSVGLISEYDVDHAATSGSIIVNFNNQIPPHIRQRASENKVRIIDHSVIYHVADEIKAALSDLLPMSISHRVVGEADVLQVFSINIKKRVTRNIAGCRVRNGAIKRTSMVKVLRRGEVVYEGKIDTLKHVKKDVMEMGKGTECGIGFEDFQDLQPDDQVQTYEVIKEKRYL
ncbi:hypothetical protein B0T10DRAFT_484240 [Thelonectria olida]|uniref:Translation initiation factor IF-2, mitochondrial n=1 Tax=Thelonectria olida TaxID=1576542 RepID=A0A9P8W6Y0_9HYPO|nr:hypothetical protein B0T10DRAFT_484240 [Thelonectria olida]